MKPFLIVCSIVLSFSLYAQSHEPIATDRPDQTETPSIVPKGMFQAETGFNYQKNNHSSTSWTLPSTLWKYGATENFELRLITEFVTEEINVTKTSGIIPLLIGCKIKICSENGWLPKTSFIGHLSLPNAASKLYKADFCVPEFRFTMQHTLSNKLSLGYNLGSEWDGYSAEPTFIYTLTTGYSVTQRLGSYIELFGFAPQRESANHNFDGGFTYLITPNFMVDLSAGVGLTHNAPDHYCAVGISFRI